MYQERSSIFSVKKVFLAILVIVLVFFILMWLFPTKGYLINNSKSASVAKTFSDNITLMKDAALSYYTDERLPQTTGDKEKMTLSEMIDNHLITELVDSNNKICNLKKSYVEITKEETEYLMKINLSCDDKSDYINTHMGSYTYCVADICEKKNKLNSQAEEIVVTENLNNESDTSADDNNASTNITNEKSISCQYVKTISTYTAYGNWSEWSKTKVTSSNTRNVQTKVVQEQTGTEKEAYTTEARYKAKVQVVNGQTIYICSSEYENAGRYTSEPVCKKTITQYKTVPVYSNITYYRYQDRKVVNQTITKWDSCNSNLINQGYRKTGVTK